MAQELNIEQKLADLLDTRDFYPETLGKDGRPADASEAKTFTFDYVSGSRKNYGTMVIVLADDNEMMIMYGDNLGKTMEDPDDRDEFFEFQQQLMELANRNRWNGTLMDISKLKRVQAGIAAIKEGLFEGYYGNRRTSYSGEATEARLVINHNRVLGENDKRYRYVESLFIETADRERFKLPFTNLAGGRAMLEHVRQGGKPYDIRGCHINEMVTEMKVLSRFNRASQGRVVEGVTQEITEQAHTYYQSLRESIKRMGTPRGYNAYFESWHPAEISEQEELVENIKTMFIEQTLDTRIEEALPLLARIQQQGNAMKEADIFESWINRLAEGTWEEPKTPEQLTKLKELLAKDLIVGPDGTNAKELLGGIVGDDILFDRIEALAKQDADANAWNDTEVMARLKELGIDTSPQEPAGVLPDDQPEEPVAPTNDMPQEPAMAPVSEADDIATFESINAIRKAAGLPVVESRNAEGSEYIDELVGKILALEKPGMSTDSDSDEFHKAVYDELIEVGMTPKAARYKISYDEDFMSDVASAYHHFMKHPEGNEGMLDEVDFDSLNQMASHAVNALGQGGAGVAAAATGAALGGLVGKGIEKTSNYFQKKKQDKAYDNLKKQATNEGSCNATMEGEYCPEHGLMECGSYMESMGGTVAGAVAPMEEGQERDQYYYKRNNIWRVMDDDELVDEYTPARYEVVGAKKLLAQYNDNNIDVTHVISPMGTVTYLYGKPGMDEGNDDPINSNSAITGAYYESKDGDALLARIKSLALIK